MKLENPESNSDIHRLAENNLTPLERKGTFERMMDYQGLTLEERETLKRSDLHFVDETREIFSGVALGHILENIGSGEGRKDGILLTKEEEARIHDELYGLAVIIEKSQHTPQEAWKSEENSPEFPV